MRVAIVGTGISGLVAAHHLHPGNEITLFEANDYVGGHTNTIDVDHHTGQFRVDTGFIVFNHRTYPNFLNLINDLGVATQPSNMSFSIHDEDSGLEYNGESVNKLFAQRKNLLRPKFYRMVSDILRFNRQAVRQVDGLSEDVTVDAFIETYGYSEQFARHYLLPMGAAIWSCPVGTFGQFPIRFIIEFYHNHGLLQVVNRPTWYVIQHGSRSYVERLIEPFRHRIRLQTPVLKVRRREDSVDVQTADGTQSFEEIVFACHSDQALRLLEDPTPEETEVLSGFPYSRNTAVLHTDESILPNSRRAWAAWNYRVGSDTDALPTVTYNMNILQSLKSNATFCVTLNQEGEIDPDKVISRHIYHHPVFTVHRRDLQLRHRDFIRSNQTSYCGAYWGNGFHEDGVVSGMAVANAFGCCPLPVRPSDSETTPLASSSSSGSPNAQPLETRA